MILYIEHLSKKITKHFISFFFFSFFKHLSSPLSFSFVLFTNNTYNTSVYTYAYNCTLDLSHNSTYLRSYEHSSLKLHSDSYRTSAYISSSLLFTFVVVYLLRISRYLLFSSASRFVFVKQKKINVFMIMCWEFIKLDLVEQYENKNKTRIIIQA